MSASTLRRYESDAVLREGKRDAPLMYALFAADSAVGYGLARIDGDEIVRRREGMDRLGRRTGDALVGCTLRYA